MKPSKPGGAATEMLRSPTFLVGTEKQRGLLDEFQRRGQQFSEEYQKNKPLCFSARQYQKTHPGKMQNGHKDADATLASPMLLGVADGVSQLEEFGMDASELPKELLRTCEEIAMSQLVPTTELVAPQDKYRGPVSLLKEAYESTESYGSTTVLLAVLDNSTRIHGKLHPMVAVLTIGDCELLMLRRVQGRRMQFEAVFHTEMQRIDGHVQTPLQLARVDERVDPEFDEDLALEVIERGSAVHCVSAYEGDLIVLGSDGVFDNLFLDEVVDLCNELMPPNQPGPNFRPTQASVLSNIARRIVEDSHAKSKVGSHGQLPETPIGRGGKMDDTSVVVGEVVEWTPAHSRVWEEVRRNKQWGSFASCGGIASTCKGFGREADSGDEHEIDIRDRRSPRTPPSVVDSDGEEEEKCSIL